MKFKASNLSLEKGSRDALHRKKMKEKISKIKILLYTDRYPISLIYFSYLKIYIIILLLLNYYTKMKKLLKWKIKKIKNNFYSTNNLFSNKTHN